MNGGVCAPHKPWDWSGLRPIVDALGKQTNKRIAVLSHGQSSKFAPATIVVGHAANGLQCARAMLQARDHFGVMGWIHYTAFVSTSRGMLNGQLWLEKTDLKNV